ncbi:MAG: Ig-like domain-containing protein [Anaeromyxobacter sp.]|nr:Ig-like domain-containing protein [Anaeromyxobacter sp.]
MTTTTTTMRRFGLLLATLALAACGQQPEATLQQLQIAPVVTEVTENLQAEVVATAIYSDGSRRDVTAEVAWSSQDEQVATTPGAGRVQAGAPGSTYLIAQLDGLQTTARVDVAAATLLSLQVSTAQAAVPAGLSAQAQALGTFSDGSVRDVTASVVWAASSRAVSIQAGGELRALAPGLVELRAYVGDVTGSAQVEVTAAAVVSLSLEGVARLAAGLATPVRLIATFTDGSVADVSAQATFEIANADVARMEDLQTLHTLRAGYTELRASFGGQTTSVAVGVSAAVLSSLEISASTPAIRRGDLVLYTATGTFSDGAQADLTAQVTWTTADPLVAVVSNSIRAGAVLALAAGSTSITALHPGTQVTATAAVVVAP